jgi:hypothetical protein
MTFWQHSLHDAAEQYTDERQSKCEQSYDDRSGQIGYALHNSDNPSFITPVTGNNHGNFVALPSH